MFSSEVWRLAVLDKLGLGGDGSLLPGEHGGLGGVGGRLLLLGPLGRGCSLLVDPGGRGDGDRGLPSDRGCSPLGSELLAGDLGRRCGGDDGD